MHFSNRLESPQDELKRVQRRLDQAIRHVTAFPTCGGCREIERVKKLTAVVERLSKVVAS